MTFASSQHLAKGNFHPIQKRLLENGVGQVVETMRVFYMLRNLTQGYSYYSNNWSKEQGGMNIE